MVLDGMASLEWDVMSLGTMDHENILSFFIKRKKKSFH